METGLFYWICSANPGKQSAFHFGVTLGREIKGLELGIGRLSPSAP